MAKRIWLILILILQTSLMFAQVYRTQKTQHRFAQTYFGINAQIIPASGRLISQNQESSIPMATIPRFTIGGLHFWGKLDFNINFPLRVLSDTNLPEGSEVDFTSGADFSIRYYPWRLIDRKPRPFLGVSFNTMQLNLQDPTIGNRIEGFITSSILAGVSYSINRWQLNAEWMFMPQNGRDFYSNTEEKHRFKLPRSYFSIGLVKHFDFTLSEEVPKISGKTQTIHEKLQKAGKLNSLSIGFGANGSYFFSAPSYSEVFKSIPRHKGSSNLEYSLGYLIDKLDLHVGLTYRNYQSNSFSYGLEHVVRRQALSLEGFKFICNYKGFSPFLGISLSAERWATGLFVDDAQQGSTSRSSIFSPGIIFGWDIKPSPIDTWVLRTNLRYYPYQEINDSFGGRSRVDQFEFNFIQFVFYPNRWVNVRRARK